MDNQLVLQLIFFANIKCQHSWGSTIRSAAISWYFGTCGKFCSVICKQFVDSFINHILPGILPHRVSTRIVKYEGVMSSTALLIRHVSY